MDFTYELESGIKSIYKNTPDNIIMTSFGHKKISGQKTEELCVVFGVEKKLSLDELSGQYIVPKTIEIDNQTYKTDVVEFPIPNSLACYNWSGSPLPPEIQAHRSRQRPLKGGIVISVDPFEWVGTLGLICVDTGTQSLVGLTNAHVAIGVPQAIIPETVNELNASSYNTLGKRVVQFTEGDFINIPTDIVGYIHKYFPLKTGSPDENYIDAATFTIRKCNTAGTSFIDNNESFKQLGINYNTPMPFATSQEINSLVANNIPIYSAGRTTGPKGTENCRLIPTFNSVNTTVNFDGILIDFFDTLVFENEDASDYPIAGGDSGSIVIGDFNGTFKIVGLAFAGTEQYAIFCRIDVIAQELGLAAWDGTQKTFIANSPFQLSAQSFSALSSNTSSNNSKNWTINSGQYWFAGFIDGQTYNDGFTFLDESSILPCYERFSNIPIYPKHLFYKSNDGSKMVFENNPFNYTKSRVIFTK